MGKRSSLYLSDYDEQCLARSGLTLIEVVRKGFAAIELEADLAKVTIPSSRRDPLKVRPGRKDPQCTHPANRVHKGLCGACGQGGL